MNNGHSENAVFCSSFKSLTSRHKEIRKKLHDLWMQQGQIQLIALKHQQSKLGR